MRSLALAEEAAGRGWEVRLAGDLDEVARARVRTWLPDAALEHVGVQDVPAWLGTLHARTGVDVLHVDSYRPEADVLPRGPRLVSNMQDGPFGARRADLAIDANLGGEQRLTAVDARTVLAGVTVVPIRQQVLRQRALRQEQGTPARTGPPRVLVVLGGTDPFGATTTVVAGLDAVPADLELTVVTPPGQREAIEELAATSVHRIDPVAFLDDLPGAAARHDLVISAAGTSVWELACLGVPMALLCVADNQREGYDAVVEAGLAIGLGRPAHSDLHERLAALGETLRHPAGLAQMQDRGRGIVDGLGAWRIVSAWEQLLDVPQAGPERSGLVGRPATLDDARALFDWRNDPVARVASRSREEVAWDDHIAWLRRTLATPARRLLVIESEGSPVGVVRWDSRGDHDWEVSITVAPVVRGHGLALPLLRAGEEELGVAGPVRLVATVHRDNVASRRLFQRAGYLPLMPSDADGFATYARLRV
ncbi:bifunctional UDP-2,4-diacetamido-2,4,6-trideoxy-beta-L-altropyranose hydrolase/GNAT family N-acetyltransferase [Nocardioides terrae]|nr:bifunctional UDP-2,4-diacetamido-2,4,6-trideoxy-beta-L-altropyranose hydrolase/GNAT family N-acetyltransferase [Nocardioides terrae]